jgi:hypothetical protein
VYMLDYRGRGVHVLEDLDLGKVCVVNQVRIKVLARLPHLNFHLPHTTPLYPMDSHRASWTNLISHPSLPLITPIHSSLYLLYHQSSHLTLDGHPHNPVPFPPLPLYPDGQHHPPLIQDTVGKLALSPGIRPIYQKSSLGCLSQSILYRR